MTKILIYDFDGTLTPFPVSQYKVVYKLGFDSYTKFLSHVVNRIKEEKLNNYEAFFYSIVDCAKAVDFDMNEQSFYEGADEVVFNPGVLDYFKELSNRNINNYIITSGLGNYLSKTKIAPYFKRIFGSKFSFDENGKVNGYKYILSDDKKVENIEKILIENKIDDHSCNDVIYLGDGLTDIPAMQFIRSHGGTTIFLYYDSNADKLNDLKENGAISYFVKADYRKDTELFNLVQKLIKE